MVVQQMGCEPELEFWCADKWDAVAIEGLVEELGRKGEARRRFGEERG